MAKIVSLKQPVELNQPVKLKQPVELNQPIVKLNQPVALKKVHKTNGLGKLVKDIAKKLGFVSLGMLTLNSCSKNYPIQGYIVADTTQHIGNYHFYRPWVNIAGGQVNYAILGDSTTVEELDRTYNVGDFVGIDPNTNIISLNEVILLPQNIEKIK